MPNTRRSTQTETQYESMRCVVDDRGIIVFASLAVGWALGVSATDIVTKPAASFLNIIPPNNAPQPLKFSEITSGFYEVALLRQQRDPVMLQARIDIVEAPNAKKYAVIWLDPDNQLKRQKNNDFNQVAHDFATFVVDSQRMDEKRTAKGPNLSHISKADGELRHFLNITHDLLGVYRRDGSFVRVNPAFNRVLGYSDIELRQRPFIDLILQEDRDTVISATRDMLSAAPEHGVQSAFEARARCRNGHICWMQWVHKAVGEHVYIVGRDVTAIKQHEIELERREQQLSEAQKIGRMGHWYWEVDQEEVEWSDQIYSIFGVEKETFIPTINNINSLVLKRDLGKIYKSFQRSLKKKRNYDLGFRLRRPKGGIRYIHCEGSCKTDPVTGQVTALFGIMQDITERTLHEQALREAKEAAESAYASKTRFLANMSHELRTPLNAIIGFSEMMQHQLLGPLGNARYLDYVAGIRESGEHLLNLINDILDMSKIEIGKYELHVEELNVGKLVRLAVHMVEGRASEGQVKLVTDDIPDDVHITADRRALMQIFLNLLSNAVKFTNPGGTVEMKCMNDVGGIVIMVSDTGIGIPKDKIQVVTLPFEQVGSELTRKHEGSGLGLAITKNLVEMHGGTMEIESEMGIGTTVSVLLPQKPRTST